MSPFRNALRYSLEQPLGQVKRDHQQYHKKALCLGILYQSQFGFVRKHVSLTND